MKRILNLSSFSSPGTRDETNEENLGTDGDENTNTNTSNNNNTNAKMMTSSEDGAEDSLLFPSEEQTEEQLVSAIKDWNNMKPVVVLNTISSLCVIVLARS